MLAPEQVLVPEQVLARAQVLELALVQRPARAQLLVQVPPVVACLALALALVLAQAQQRRQLSVSAQWLQRALVAAVAAPQCPQPALAAKPFARLRTG